MSQSTASLFDISVIIACYHSSLEKIVGTIKSILCQRGVSCEIVFADDGSDDFDEKAIRHYLKTQQFADFAFSILPKNEGTVSNIYHATSLCKGRYIKTIAPGDYLYDEDTLRQWAAFMDEKNATFSFGNAAYFTSDDGEVRLSIQRNQPSNLNIFKRPSKKRFPMYYVFGDDLILGAALLAKAAPFRDYLSRIYPSVIYAEDMLYRLAAFEGEHLFWFDHCVVWYEFGSGISTSKNDVWRDKLVRDYIASNQLIINSSRNDKTALRIKRVLASKSRLRKYFAFPSLIWFRILKKVRPSKTACPHDCKMLLEFTDAGRK